MNIPKLNPNSLPPFGAQLVFSKSHKLPGAVSLLSPSTMSTTPIKRVAKTESREVYEMILSGRNEVGIKRIKAMSLYAIGECEGTTA